MIDEILGENGSLLVCMLLQVCFSQPRAVPHGWDDDIGRRVQKSDDISTPVSAIGIEWWRNTLRWLINMNSRASELHLNHGPSEVDNRAISEKSPKTINICEVWSWAVSFSMWYSWPGQFTFAEGRAPRYFSKSSKYSVSTASLCWYPFSLLCSLLRQLILLSGSLWCNRLTDWIPPRSQQQRIWMMYHLQESQRAVFILSYLLSCD